MNAVATIQFTVNGQRRAVTTDPDRPLLDVLREDLQLTGAKYGCGESRCGACSVLVDGRRVFSCRTPASTRRGQGDPSPSRAWPRGTTSTRSSRRSSTRGRSSAATARPGMIMAAVALLDEKPEAHRRRDRLGDEPEHLPVLQLSQDPPRPSAGASGREGR